MFINLKPWSIKDLLLLFHLDEAEDIPVDYNNNI